MDAARYSIVKAIVTYRPTEVIESLYKSPAEFVAALMTFLTNRIRRNKEDAIAIAFENLGDNVFDFACTEQIDIAVLIKDGEEISKQLYICFVERGKSMN